MPYDLSALYARRTRGMRPSAVRDILRVSAQPDIISLAGGLPAPELFPVDQLRQAFDAVLSEEPSRALQYSVTEGYGPLRAFLADRLGRTGAGTDTERILITNGSQQALDIVGKVFLDPGDAVVIESPSYLGAVQAFDQYQPSYLVVPTDDDGMDVEALEVALAARSRAGGRPPKFIYCVPEFQNPSGRTLAAERRPRLLQVAGRWGIPIVEDEPYGELRFEGKPQGSLRSLDEAGVVIHLGTFSKVLAPGLRVGWLVAPSAELARTFVLAKQPADLHSCTLVQMAIHRLVADGFLDRHIPLIRDTYRSRRDALVRALDETLPTGSRRSHPEGGLFVWVDLPDAIDTSELLVSALREKVAFVPGRSFHVDGGGTSSMRLNFSAEAPGRLREATRRLGAVIDSRMAAIVG